MNGVEVLIPQSPHIAFVRGSLECEGCLREVSATAMEVFDQVQLNLGSVQAGQRVTVNWYSKVKEIEPAELVVGDFDEPADGLDDIVVPWGDNVIDEYSLAFLSSNRIDNDLLANGWLPILQLPDRELNPSGRQLALLIPYLMAFNANEGVAETGLGQ